MRILVTGATGFLGFRTLEHLISEPEVEKIIATGRKLKRSHQVVNPKVEYILGDLSNPEFAEQLVAKATHIVHAAALSSPWGSFADFESANVKCTQNLIQSAKRFQIKLFVFISTPSMYFDLKNRLRIKESDPLPTRFINAYAETKRKAEIRMEESKIPFIILRPRALIGRGDTVIMPRLIRAYDEGKLKIIGNGENWVDLTSVSNVADAIFLSLKAKPQALNQTFNISNGKPLKLWGAISDILTKLGKKSPTQKVPFVIVKGLAKWLELKSKLTDMKEPALTVYGAGVLALSCTLDISKAQKLLGYSPKVSTNDAITEFVQWYLEDEKS